MSLEDLQIEKLGVYGVTVAILLVIIYFQWKEWMRDRDHLREKDSQLIDLLEKTLTTMNKWEKVASLLLSRSGP